MTGSGVPAHRREQPAPGDFLGETWGSRPARHSITAIRHGDSGTAVSYREFGKERTMDADYLVCAMSAVMLRQIPVTPQFSESKKWAVENVPYYSATRPVLQSRTKFWREEGLHMNIAFGRSTLEHVWSMPDDVKTQRV